MIEPPDEDPALSRRLFAAVTRFISPAANAQSDTLGDIVVFGGGQVTTTDTGVARGAPGVLTAAGARAGQRSL